MRANRETVISVIRVLSSELGERYAREAPIQHMEEPEILRAALVIACEVCDISVDEYLAALRADPSLAELEKESMTQAVVGMPDPGPYDEISPESPSGQPGDLKKSRTVPTEEALSSW